MDEFEVLAIRDLDFTDEKNHRIIGQQLWLCGQTTDPSWKDWEVLKVWIPDDHDLTDTVADLRHGDRVLVEFNRRGKPRAIARTAC